MIRLCEGATSQSSLMCCSRFLFKVSLPVLSINNSDVIQSDWRSTSSRRPCSRCTRGISNSPPKHWSATLTIAIQKGSVIVYILSQGFRYHLKELLIVYFSDNFNKLAKSPPNLRFPRYFLGFAAANTWSRAACYLAMRQTYGFCL